MTKSTISKAVGIDLGTTNSAVAVMNTTDTDIIIHQDEVISAETTPSCVWKNPKPKDGVSPIVVGRTAFRRIGTIPVPIRSIKRSMGKLTTVQLTNEEATPEQISSYILAEMKQQVEKDVAQFATDSTEWIVDRAIVTVPAYFDQPAIDATRKAAEMAGLQILELLQEPTAAAYYYCWQHNIQNGVFLVYDFGGGTFDVSVVRSTDGLPEVLGISGNNRLGGDDIDAAIAEDLRQRLMRDKEAAYELHLDMNEEEDRLRFDQMKLIAEGLKKALSNASEFYLRDALSLRDKADERVNIEIMFRRQEVETIMRPIVERTIPYCYEALEIARERTKGAITLADVDAIILAGGTTHIPLVREIVRKAFCADPDVQEPRAKCSEPVYEKVDTIVALGAAIRAAAVGGLAVYNPEHTVRVAFRGTAATGSTQTSVAGEVEALAPNIDLTNGKIRLSITEQGYRDEEPLKVGGSFRFTRIPLQPGTENLLTFEVFDQNGELVATAGRPLKESEKAILSPISMSILVKAFSLEVTRAGKPYIEELLPAMTSIPVSKDFQFIHPGDTELIRLPLYQHKTIIQEIQVPVPSSLPRGEHIDLNIHVDKLSFITIKGKIGNIPFDAVVELPPERPLPTEEEIQKLERDFENAIAFLPQGPKNTAQVRYRTAKKSFEAAIKLGDKEQAIHEFEEMEIIVANVTIGGPQPLEPPKYVFDKLLKECYELNQYAAQMTIKAGATQPHDAKELAKAIDVQRDRGEKAFKDGDQGAYSETIGMLENIHDHLVEVIQKHMPPPPPISDEERAAEAIKATRKEAERVSQLATAQGRMDMQDEIEEIKRTLHEQEREIQHNAQGVLREVQFSRQRLEQIKNVLANKRPDPTGDGKRVEKL